MTTITNYTYDIEGYRIEKETDDGVITNFVFDLSGNMIEEVSEGNSTQYVFMGITHIAKIDSEGKRFYYGTNHLGSTTLTTDESGKTVEDYSGETTPFGDQENKNIIYTGKHWDEDAGLYYFNARWYDSDTGGFITEDPIKDGSLWYAYCNSNPMRYIDHDGLTIQDQAIQDKWNWTNNGDGSYTAGEGSVLSGLSDDYTNDLDWEEGRDPKDLQEGEIVWLSGSGDNDSSTSNSTTDDEDTGQSEGESDDDLDPNGNPWGSGNKTVGNPNGGTDNVDEYNAYAQNYDRSGYMPSTNRHFIQKQYDSLRDASANDSDTNSRRYRSGFVDGKEVWLAEFIQVDLSVAYGLPKGIGYCWVRYTNIYDPYAPVIYAEYLVTVNIDTDAESPFQNRDLSEIEATLDDVREIGPRGFSTSPGFSGAVSIGSATALFSPNEPYIGISDSWNKYFNQHTGSFTIPGTGESVSVQAGYFESLSDSGNILWKGNFVGAAATWDPLDKYIPKSRVNYALTRPYYETVRDSYETSDGFKSLLW